MKTFGALEFETLIEDDIETLTQMMTKVFDEDTKVQLNESKGGPDGYDNDEFLRRFTLHEVSTSYKILVNGRVIGGLILWINHETQIHFSSNIFIDSRLQNKGIGKKVWQFIEAEYPDTLKWCTETPEFSTRNHHFYINKCGFHLVKIEPPFDRRECQYLLEKCWEKKI